LLVEVKHYLIRCHVRSSYLLLGMIGRFRTRTWLSLLVRLPPGNPKLPAPRTSDYPAFAKNQENP
jgi:hypothetical protein